MRGKLNLLSIARWFFGLLFLLAGIGNFSTQIVSSLFSLALGLLLLPPSSEALFSRVKFQVSRSHKLIIAFILLCLTVFTSPSAKTTPSVPVSASPPPSATVLPSEPANASSEPSPLPSPSPSVTPTPKLVTPQPSTTSTQLNLQETTNRPVETTNTGGYACNCRKTCEQLSCAEAQYQLNSCGCSRRDADGDGIACDRQCGG